MKNGHRKAGAKGTFNVVSTVVDENAFTGLDTRGFDGSLEEIQAGTRLANAVVA